DIPTMLKVGNVAVSYRYEGNPPDISIPEISPEDQQSVNGANEHQIIDLVNTVRVRAGLGIVTWNNEVASVARSHSDDMKVNQFFAHDSPFTGSPFDRLGVAGITYSHAGENIAMGYRTSISVHEGWMNSKGHRDNVLKPEYTTLGVGALSEYFTQNFVTPK
ncbi:MAG: CAP domain-containing protein, partial [Bacilli bacterium]